MPDITMCSGANCAQRNECYRARAIPSERQSYFAAPPAKRDGTCAYFLKLRSKDLLAPIVEIAGEKEGDHADV